MEQGSVKSGLRTQYCQFSQSLFPSLSLSSPHSFALSRGKEDSHQQLRIISSSASTLGRETVFGNSCSWKFHTWLVDSTWITPSSLAIVIGWAWVIQEIGWICYEKKNNKVKIKGSLKQLLPQLSKVKEPPCFSLRLILGLYSNSSIF